MNKDAVIQIRVTNEEKQKLKKIADFFDTTVSRLLTKYLDDTLEKGYIELRRTTNDNVVNHSHKITEEELEKILVGASTAIPNKDYSLANKILDQMYLYKMQRKNKEEFINIRYSSDKKSKIESLAKNNDLTISSLLDNYIKSSIYDYNDFYNELYVPDEEIEEEIKKAKKDIEEGNYYTEEEFKKIIKIECGIDLND